MATKKYEQIYVELDVLLDTRLGTLARLSPEAAAAALASGKYHTRLSDVFEGVDPEAFKTLYQNRDTETLKYSVATNAILIAKDVLRHMAVNVLKNPLYEGTRLIVNLYPYKLTDSEKDAIRTACSAWISSIALVELVDISPEDLTPEYCKNEFAVMFVYEYAAWLELHTYRFASRPIPEVTIYAPGLYRNTVPTDEQLKECIRDASHPFQAEEKIMSFLVNLTLIDISHFSVMEQLHLNPNSSDPKQGYENQATGIQPTS